MKDKDVNVRILRTSIYGRKKKSWFEDPFQKLGRKDTLQYFDPKEGWKDIPVEYVDIDLEDK